MQIPQRLLPISAWLLSLTIASGTVNAQELLLTELVLTGLTPAAAGLKIAEEVDRRDQGFINFTADMAMHLSNAKGDTSIRKIRIRTLEGAEDGDKSLSLFDDPPDVKGTVSLTYSHGLQPDDQWLYLPALKRVKRIHSKNKSGPFMGSEFAFEDIASPEVQKYKHKYLREEMLDQIPCWVSERIPAYAYSGYTRQQLWTDKSRMLVVKIEYYDRKNTLLKTLRFADYHQYLNKFWRAHKMLMTNHQTRKSTQLLWSNFQFQTNLTVRDFDQNALRDTR